MQNPQQLQGIGSFRQPYGLGGFLKKAFKKVKKVAKSPLGKAALLGAGAYFAPMMWGQGAGLGGWGKGLASLTSRFGGASTAGGGGFKGFASKWLTPFNTKNPLLYTDQKLSGKKMFGLGAGAMVAAPFIQKALGYGPYEE